MEKKSFHFSKVALALLCLVMFNPFSSKSQNGPACDTYTNVATTILTGLGDSYVQGVYASGSTVYVATAGGLSISTNGGASFTNKTTTDGLGSSNVFDVYASGSTVYAATGGGLSISTNGGASFTNKTTTNGLGSDNVFDVYASGDTVYAATFVGLSISTNGGASFTNKTTVDGLGSNYVSGVYASGSTVYAATNGGLSISTNGGASFTNKTNADGLGSNRVNGVYASGDTVYAATSTGLSISTNGGASFTNKTTTDGLGSNDVFDVYASGSTVYAATIGGLSISTDGGVTFLNKGTTIPSGSGLGGNIVNGVYASGSTVYAATDGGLSISTNGGASFTNKTTANGLGINFVLDVYASGDTVYAATFGGLSISTDGGASFTNKTMLNGLGSDFVFEVYALGSTVYAATLFGGLSISTDGGASFTNYTTLNGLGSNNVYGVYASGSKVYAATDGGLSSCPPSISCTPTSSTQTVSACGSYLWNGTTYTTSGVKTFTTTNAAGCDSVVTLNLTINQPNTSTTTITATGSYSWNGNSYTSTGTYTWTGTNVAGCDSVATLSLTINAVIGSNITNVCPYIGTNQTLTYTASVAGASSYAWTLPANTQLISGQGTRSIVIKILNGFANQANKQIRVTPAGGSLQIIYLAAQAPVTPATITASTSNVCGSLGTNVPITYTIPKSGAATSYIWTAQNSTTNISHPNGTGVNDTTIAITFASGFTSSNVSVQAVNACGVSNSRTYAVTLAIPSQPSLISGPTNVCANIGESGSNSSYFVNAVAAVETYTWTLPQGAFNVSGQGTNAISFRYPAGFTNGTISVIAANGCGSSSSRSLSVSRLLPATPGNIDVINTVACPNRTYTYTIASMPSNATSLLWTIPASGTLLSGQGTTSITVSYPGSLINGKVTVKAIANCAISATREVNVKLPPCPQGSTGNPLTKGINTVSTGNLEVKLYPNPTINNFNMQVLTGNEKEVRVRIMDVQGRMIKSLIAIPYQTINIGNDLKPGVYMVELKQGNEVKTERVVKY